MNVNLNQCKSTLFIIIDQTFREIIVNIQNIQNVFNKKLGKSFKYIHFYRFIASSDLLSLIQLAIYDT